MTDERFYDADDERGYRRPYERISVTRSQWWFGQRRNPAGTQVDTRYEATAGTGGSVTPAFGFFILPESEIRSISVSISEDVNERFIVSEGSVYPILVPVGSRIYLDRAPNEWHDGYLALGMIQDPRAVRTIRPDTQESRRVSFDISAAQMAAGGLNIYIPQLPATTGLQAVRGYASNGGAGSAAFTPFRVYRAPEDDAALLEVQMPTATLAAGQSTAIAQGDSNAASAGYRCSITGGTAGQIKGGITVSR